jgi:hypothetical protein
VSDDQPKGELILYQTEDGRAAIHLRAVDGTVWLTQAEIAALFDTTLQNVNLHLKNLFKNNELDTAAVVKDSLITAADAKTYMTRLYNLDAVLAVGYRVRSPRGSQFRRWATTTLRDYLIKGFAIDDARMKEPGGLDYFDELLERIRDIRASEKRFYQKIRDLFAATSVDYAAAAPAAKTFFATIQNKLVFAVTGRTAAELIVERADPAKPNIAKNYLSAEEINELNRLTTMFLDFAEDRASRRQQIRMVDWTEQTDRFLAFNERQVLKHAGRVSHDRMEAITHQHFATFDTRRRAEEAAAAEREAEADMVALEKVAKRLSKPGRTKV